MLPILVRSQLRRRLFLKQKPPKNKSVNRGVLSDTRKCPFRDQLYHTFHHDLTIKTPHTSTQYSQNPLQKRQNSGDNATEKNQGISSSFAKVGERFRMAPSDEIAACPTQACQISLHSAQISLWRVKSDNRFS
jgi:hypothetical protein